jgi:SAM-dependent methyltransferase
MVTRGFLSNGVLALWLLSILIGGSAYAQPAPSYKPQVGQDGKDVVWVPTPQALVDKMLDMAKVTSKDYVIDLGSGDGRTVITAAQRGARALGIEYNPDLVELSSRAAAKEGVSERAKFMKADIFESDFSEASVITMFLLSSINLKLRPKILNLRPGIRIVSNSFDMGEWQADETGRAEGCNQWCTAYLWIVPAKVGGSWKLGKGELRLEQTFQKISGTLRTGNVRAPITNGKLSGDRISFTASGKEYTGQVSGTAMAGTIKDGGNWNAVRATKRQVPSVRAMSRSGD